MFTEKTTISEVLATPELSDVAPLLFPIHLSLDRRLTLGVVAEHFPWYSFTSGRRTVAVLNHLLSAARRGEQIFYPIYTKEEIARTPAKANTGLFFFKGEAQQKTAIISAGGGFHYVAGLQDSFPHALELSRRGFNAFALIYRPSAKGGREDLARAIAFLHEQAEELQIEMAGYSLWGGSAGARLSAWLGTHGTAAYGEAAYPRPSTVVTAYTGLSEVTGEEPATFAVVGTRDWIADYRVMEDRIRRIQRNGTPAKCLVYLGLPHGFGLGEGTVAEGWLHQAADFWREQLDSKKL